MEGISFTAHVSNKKSAITSKSKLAGVAKHNLRKYKSEEYSADNIFLICSAGFGGKGNETGEKSGDCRAGI